jgi:DNA-binding transcriptional regulator YiaG
MAKKFSDLVGPLNPDERTRVDAKKAHMREETRLYDLRRARHLSQETVAETLGVPQSAVSKIERRADAYISTIRRYLEAIGGELIVVARFDDGTEVEIKQFAAIGEPVEA